MGRRSPLLRAVITLTVFWWVVSTLVFASLPPVAFDAWLTLNGVPHPVVTPLNHLSVVVDLYRHIGRNWGVSVLYGVLAAIVGSMLLLALFQWIRLRRARPPEPWRGVSTTLGPLLTIPASKAVATTKLPAKPKTNPLQRRFIEEILGFLSGHKKAFVGAGHKGTLVEHTLNVMSEAVWRYPDDVMMLMLAACHDIGKTVAWKRGKDGEWQRVAWHAQEGAKLLARFDSWWTLPVRERTLLRYAIAYEHSPARLPARISGLDYGDMEDLRVLLARLREVDGLATGEEKQATLEGVDVGKAVLEAFLMALPELSFHEQGVRLQPGVNGAGWRVDDSLFLVEHLVRERAMRFLSEDVQAALGGDLREQGNLAPYTQALFAELHKRGWLVLSWEKAPLPGQEKGELAVVRPEFPLFNIKAGNQPFNGVFVVRLGTEEQRVYPLRQSKFPILVTGVQAGGQAAVEATSITMPDQEVHDESEGESDAAVMASESPPAEEPNAEMPDRGEDSTAPAASRREEGDKPKLTPEERRRRANLARVGAQYEILKSTRRVRDAVKARAEGRSDDPDSPE